jgi:very-short-patch-repair endonuclease
MKILYRKDLKQISRKLRNNSTLSEVLLWQQIKGRKVLGYQFMRQKPVNNYVVDFYCSKLKLIIEIDGGTHSDNQAKDKKRQEIIEGSGLSFLRFSDEDVKTNLAGVLDYLVDWIKECEKKEK